VPGASDLAPQRERPSKLDTDDEPRLRASVRMQHHAQDAVDAEYGCQRPTPFNSSTRSRVLGGKCGLRS
jgi:hypothetical protein